MCPTAAPCQNVQLPYAPVNISPTLPCEPTTLPRPPSVTGVVPWMLIFRFPPYRYSAATPHLKVLLA